MIMIKTIGGRPRGVVLNCDIVVGELELQLQYYIQFWIIIGLEDRVFGNDAGNRGSIPKTFKMVLDTALLNTQQYEVRIKGKVEQSWERSSALPYTSV